MSDPYRQLAAPAPERKPWRCRLGLHKYITLDSDDYDYWSIEQCTGCGKRQHVTYFADHIIRSDE
jgi:hypothetical protein